jgi:anti-sigma-K factor RskA
VSTPHPPGCDTDAAAYALGALTADEAATFETHLAGCVVCRDELAAFEQTVGVLALGAPQTPAPNRLRRHVMSAVRADVAAQAQRVAPAARPRFSFPRPVLGRPAIGLACAAVVALAAAGGIQLFSSGTTTRVYKADARTHGTYAALRVTGSHADLVVDHLAPPSIGNIYEVWLQRGTRTLPTKALFSVNSDGQGDVDVPGSLKGVSHVLVTQEPDGGSNTPTLPVLIDAALSHS